MRFVFETSKGALEGKLEGEERKEGINKGPGLLSPRAIRVLRKLYNFQPEDCFIHDGWLVIVLDDPHDGIPEYKVMYIDE